jgi:hypothetical protein
VEPEAVDLGLPSGRKWASFNVGAHAPEEYGRFFAWGETAPKDDYSWSTYAFGSSANGPFSKYVATATYGTVDNKLVLDRDDDAAVLAWSSSWRIPTEAMWLELKKNCTWTWTTLNGVNGYRVASTTNSNSIFLPAAGGVDGANNYGAGSIGHYWSAKLYESESSKAWEFYFSSTISRTAGFYRCAGHSVRPVKE